MDRRLPARKTAQAIAFVHVLRRAIAFDAGVGIVPATLAGMIAWLVLRSYQDHEFHHSRLRTGCRHPRAD